MFFVYDIATGALYSSGSVAAPPEALAAAGLAVVEVADASVPQPWTWDAEARAPVQKPADPLELEPDEFLALFTPAEWAAARASTNDQVQWLIARLQLRRMPLSMASPTVTQGVALLAAAEIITPARAAEILATGA